MTNEDFDDMLSETCHALGMDDAAIPLFVAQFHIKTVDDYVRCVEQILKNQEATDSGA